jgi:hypothetical protein
LVSLDEEGRDVMPAFAKNPKFIGGAIIVLWLVYVIWANLRLAVTIYLFPGAHLLLSVVGIMIVSALFGALAVVVIQFLWKRRSSKNASVSAAAP